jgi:hypothetical protein
MSFAQDLQIGWLKLDKAYLEPPVSFLMEGLE